MTDKLNPKQQKFAEEYLIDLNATQAAIRAGYSEETARQIGSENLSKPAISAYIETKRKKMLDKLEVTQERIVQEYARLGFLDIRKLYDNNGNLKHIQDLDDDTAAAVAGIEVVVERDKDSEELTKTHKIKLNDKKGALDSLARWKGMFVDKLELGVSADLAKAIAEARKRAGK